uniref:hypothetical protein n=1 Tax=Amycolatopsis sp. CA-151526 TaxID=3239921 RepID=UPI003F495976
MKLFGYPLGPGARWAEQQRVRAERNRRAMTSLVGETGAGAAADRFPAGGFPAAIAEEEIALGYRVLTSGQDEENTMAAIGRRKPADFRAEEIHRNLRRRLGAAAALHASPEFCPILAAEIDLLERAIQRLEKAHFREELVASGRVLLTDLHTRQGHTEAMHYLGDLPVFGATSTLAAPDPLAGEQR